MMPLAAAIPFARHELDAAIRELEKEAEGARYNTLCIRALASAAALLGQKDILDRALGLLRAAPDHSFWAGILTNIELPTIVPQQLRTIDAPEKLEEEHPAYRDEEILGRIGSYARTEEHLALCLEGKVQEARAKAGSGVRLEEVGTTFAVLGGLDVALSVARDPVLEPFRQRGVLLVLVIEFFRRGRIADAEAILAELESSELSAWERIHLALGFANREPWSSYPYPDW